MLDAIPVDEECYLISHHNCYLSASRLINCWGGVKPDKYTRWRICPTGKDGLYHIKSYDGRYLTRKWSGVVELHRKEQDEDETSWEVRKMVGLRGKTKFAFYIKGHYLLCMQTGWILANSKECDSWEQWTITTEYNEEPLNGPSGRRSAFYVCAGGFILIGGVVAATIYIATSDGKGGTSNTQKYHSEPKPKKKIKAPAVQRDCEEEAAPATCSDNNENNGDEKADADENAGDGGTLATIGNGIITVAKAAEEHGPQIVKAIEATAAVVEAGKKSLGIGVREESEYEEEYEEESAPDEGEASTNAPTRSLAESKPSTRAMAETRAPTEAPAPTIAGSRPQKKSSTKKIILVGESGVGKSTLCSMLLQGDLYPQNRREISNGATSATDCQVLEGREWTVCDTPGLGETYEGTTDTAIKPIVQVLQEKQLAFHYIAYVIKQGRLSVKDHAEHFKLFKSTFKGAERNFVLIITHCEDREWIVENQEDIISIFGDILILFCDLPFSAKNAERGKKERLHHFSEFEHDILSLDHDAILPWISCGALPPVEETIANLSINSERSRGPENKTTI
ncbi:hypothetical protein BGX21_000076 [Mortierella sp. AD011]|nr:hypothetical protein BGX20_011574 [Mortierella sp. AD010]KAF9389548.1 hypothetical protein BGX21_000076 [Mortierella sp. AD011]